MTKYPQIQAIPKTQESYAEMMRNSCDIETRSNSVTNPDNYIKPTGTVAMFSKVHHNIKDDYFDSFSCKEAHGLI